MRHRITELFENNGLFNEQRNGFRLGKSIVKAIARFAKAIYSGYEIGIYFCSIHRLLKSLLLRSAQIIDNETETAWFYSLQPKTTGFLSQ